MTPSEKNIVKSLVAVAWADGAVKEPEKGIIDGLLWAFDADEADEAEIREYAQKKRTLRDDVPIEDLNHEERELLLAHAALITHADGKQTKAEEKVMKGLSDLLGFSDAKVQQIVADAKIRASKLASRL